MKKISSRSRVILLLALLVLIGLSAFVLQYFAQAGEWVTFSGSPHVYTGNNLTTGTVLDRDGVTLLTNAGEGRIYSPDETLRKATLHLLGDRYGYIPSPMLSTYADQMLGYSPVQGLYSKTETEMRLTVLAAAKTTACEAMGDRHGCVVVYNYQTGEILCLYSSPCYDPDQIPDVEGDTTGQYDGVYVNRPLASAYTPGSIFKLVTATAALENIADLETRSFTCTGETVIDGKAVRCQHEHGTLSFADALARSCNVVFGQLAVELGAETLTECAQRLGITQSLRLDGAATAAGQFDVSEAGDWELAWAGIGQYTDLVNPLQFATLVGAIANGGAAAEPYLVSEVGSYHAGTEMLSRVMETDTAERLRELMIRNVQTVYGCENFPAAVVGAKSGTAEQDGGAMPNATFAGFLLDETYPLAFAAVVEHAGSGSEVCIPILNEVLQSCMMN